MLPGYLKDNKKAMSVSNKSFLSAREAALELGVSVDTLYAYVSRGFLRSEASTDQKRNRRYRLEDVEQLKKRRGEYRHPNLVASGTMHAGTRLGSLPLL